MKCANFAYRVGTSLALTIVAASPAHAFKILAGSDYFETGSPSSFIGPPGPLADIPIDVKGVPIGPGSTDTIVQRKGDCSYTGPLTSCTIPIEMVALSLVTTTPLPPAFPFPLFFRESPDYESNGMMTMFINATNTGGTFSSFFDLFLEVSIDNEVTYALFDWSSDQGVQPLRLTSTGAIWTMMPHGLLVDGLIGDQNANNHTDKVPIGSLFGCPITATTGEICADFFLVENGVVTEVDVMATHTARGAVSEPASLALLGIGLAGLGALRRRNS